MAKDEEVEWRRMRRLNTPLVLDRRFGDFVPSHFPGSNDLARLSASHTGVETRLWKLRISLYSLHYPHLGLPDAL